MVGKIQGEKWVNVFWPWGFRY